MGQGFLYRCSECGYEEEVTEGVLPYNDYRDEVVADAMSTEFGEIWAEIEAEHPNAQIGVGIDLFVCPVCARWKNDTDLEIFIPIDRDDRDNDEMDFPDDYFLVKSFPHICEKCGKEMLQVDMKPLRSMRPEAGLNCPKCGKFNTPAEIYIT